MSKHNIYNFSTLIEPDSSTNCTTSMCLFPPELTVTQAKPHNTVNTYNTHNVMYTTGYTAYRRRKKGSV